MRILKLKPIPLGTILQLTMILLAIIIVSCTPTILTSITKSYGRNMSNERIFLYSIKDTVPINAEYLGSVYIAEGGLGEKCSFENVIELATFETKKVGGNTLKITDYKSPRFGSPCYMIVGDIYKIESKCFEPRNDIYNTSRQISDSVDYSIINFYRPKSHFGSIIKYNVFIDDSKIWTAKNNSKFSVILEDSGKKNIWAYTESRESIFVNIESGNEYFIRCKIKMGVFVGSPQFSLMKYDVGKLEYDLME